MRILSRAEVFLAMTYILSGLESLLWEAANILRGPMDAADFKTWVLKGDLNGAGRRVLIVHWWQATNISFSSAVISVPCLPAFPVPVFRNAVMALFRHIPYPVGLGQHHAAAVAVNVVCRI